MVVPGRLSDSNSTNVPLGSGGVFTGVFDDVLNYALITITTYSDKDSATDGLEFQWSGDGINVDFSEGSSCFANVGRGFALTPRACFFRIKYTNGVQAQTTFRLHSGFHVAGTGLITRPLDKSLTLENFAQTTRSVLTAQDWANTSFSNLSLSPNNGLVTSAKNSYLSLELDNEGVIKNSPGVLHNIVINKDFASTLYLFDSTTVPASNDPHIAEIALNGIGGSTLIYDLKFNNGLSFKFSGPHGCDVLVTYE